MSSNSNSMSLLALIKSIKTTTYIINGTATYRPNTKKFINFDFKLFINGSNNGINDFQEGDLVMFSGKFAYRTGHGENPMFLSVNQAVLIPNPNGWETDTIPISHPYITASVQLNSNPLQTHCGHPVIKCQCNNVFCSYDKSKHDHEFYLYYDEDSTRWTKILQTVKRGNMKLYISGLYRGYYPKDQDNDDIYHAIQLMELNFDFNSPKSIFSRTNYNDNVDDDDEQFFGTPKTKKSSKKRDLSPELIEHSSSDSSSTTRSKKKKKKVTESAHKTDVVKVKQEIPYSHPDNQVIYPDKKTVQFNIPKLPKPNSQVNDNNVGEPSSDNRRRGANKSKSSQQSKKSPRKKGGNKIIEINDDDDEIPQRSDASLMDTESDYHTQNDDMHEEEEEDDISS